MKTVIQIFLVLVTFTAAAQEPLWEVQESGTTTNLNDVYFVSSEVGYIGGDSGTVLKTTNGGEEWSTLNTGLTEHIKTLWFFDEQTGFVGGEGGNTLYKTTDGGLSWEYMPHSLNTDAWEVIRTLYFIDENIGFAGADDGMMRTVDGGTTWTNIGSFTLIYKIDFLDDLIGYAVSSQGILKTIDGGLNWEIVQAPGAPGLQNGGIIKSIQAMTVDTVYFGAPYYSTFLSSFDGAASLNYQAISTRDMDFVTPLMGFAIIVDPNQELTIKKTEDAGENWTTQLQLPIVFANELKSLWMFDENEGWAAGHNGSIRHLVISQPTGINEFSHESITVFPNPTTDILKVADTQFQIDQMHVIDITGRASDAHTLGQNQVDVSHLPSGKYFLQVISEEKQWSIPFVKE